jgi:hypothetical protein
MHYSLSTVEEQFLVHIFLHFNFSYWKSSYVCVEVGVADGCSTTTVEWFIVAFQARAEQLLLDCNLAFCNPSSTFQQTQNISHLLSIM